MEAWRDPKKWVTQVETLEAENRKLRAELEEYKSLPYELKEVIRLMEEKIKLTVQGDKNDHG